MKHTVFKSIGLLWLICFTNVHTSIQAKEAFRLVKNDVVAFLGGGQHGLFAKSGIPGIHSDPTIR